MDGATDARSGATKPTGANDSEHAEHHGPFIPSVGPRPLMVLAARTIVRAMAMAKAHCAWACTVVVAAGTASADD